MSNISPGTMTAGTFAILLGLAGAYGVRQYLSADQEQVVVAEAPPNLSIPTAAYDLPLGKIVTKDDILLQSMSEEQAIERFGRVHYLGRTSDIIGRMLKAPLNGGELFQSDNFYPAGFGPGIAEKLKPGHVAVTIPIHNVALVSGFVTPGSQVDLIFRSHEPEERTMTLLDHIAVLAVGPAFLDDSRVTSDVGMVTVAVTPFQAQVLKAAEDRGDISLTLRNPQDIGLVSAPLSVENDHVRLEQLLGLPTGVERKTIEVYRARNRSVVEFDRTYTYDKEQYIPTPIADNPRAGGSQVSNGPPRQQVSFGSDDPARWIRRSSPPRSAAEPQPRSSSTATREPIGVEEENTDPVLKETDAR